MRYEDVHIINIIDTSNYVGNYTSLMQHLSRYYLVGT